MADLIVDNASEKEISLFYGGKYRKAVIEDGYEAEGFFPDLGDDGKWLFFTASPLLDEDGAITGAIETLQDITFRKRAEQALRESEERYRILTEYVADGVIVIQDDKTCFNNLAFRRMFGYPGSDEAISLDILSLISTSFYRHFKELIESLESGQSQEKLFQGACKRKDASEFWVDMHLDLIQWQGKPAVLATINDITESRLQRLALKEEAEHLRQENIELKSSVKDRYRFGRIIGKSPAMQNIYEFILQAGETDAGIVISGESGTGKELVATAIHKLSRRKNKEFVPVNCGAIPENLIESEFFGYTKGAFTGAEKDKKGYLDHAEEGTLFLDEVGEIGLNMQVKLLRAIEEGGFRPIGGGAVRKPDIRIIAATNKDLTEMVKTGQMRKDFYYRINIIPIQIPPLRERKEDLPLLMEHFLDTFSGDTPTQGFTGRIYEAVFNYDWPGNVRELQNLIQRFVSLKNFDIVAELKSITPESSLYATFKEENQGLRNAVEKLEKHIISNTLSRNNWHRDRVSSILKIDRKTLYSKMRKYGIKSPGMSGAK